jgi:peptidoglycan/LPS O-acetylase OafA/YrhL
VLLRFWRAFTAWRRGRPFWAGLFVAIGALIITFPPYATLKFGDMVVSIQTLGGVSALLIGVLLAICAVSLWTTPKFRLAAGIVTVLLSLVAIVVTNLGGFIFGTLFSLLGGALAVAWTDAPKEPKTPENGSETTPETTQRVQPT